jgi:hypothetical protein
MRKICVSLALALATAAFSAPVALAQDLQVKGGSSAIFSAENNTTTSSDKIAVQGLSKPTPYYGVGAFFDAGYMGVRSFATVSGIGSRYGGSFTAANGASSNYGIQASAYGPTGSTNYAGYFSGNVYVNGTLTQTSDERMKLNIKDLDGSLENVRRLKPKTYSYSHEGIAGKTLPDGNQIGFLAQDLKAIYPQLVSEVPVENPSAQKGATSETVLSVNYVGLIPVLVKAVQEQQAQIDELKAKVAKLEARR